MAGARLESKEILLHSEGWNERKAPFEMQQRVQNIHDSRRFCADLFSMSRARVPQVIVRANPCN